MLIKSHKAQASIEFMSMLSVALIIFLGFIIINTYQSQSSYDTSVRFELQRTCNDFAAGINLAASGGSGFAAYIFLPQKIRGLNYTINITERTATLIGDGKNVFCRLITSNVSYVNISTGNIILENVNGTVIIR